MEVSPLQICYSIYIGHSAYIGFLYLEHTYNNAVVQMFVRLLVKSLRKNNRVILGGSGKQSFAFGNVVFEMLHTNIMHRLISS